MKGIPLNCEIQVKLTHEGAYWYQKAWAGKQTVSNFNARSIDAPAYATSIVDIADYSVEVFPHITNNRMILINFGTFIHLFGSTIHLENRNHVNHPMIEEYILVNENDIITVDAEGKKEVVEFQLSSHDAEDLINLIVAYEDETGEDASAIREIIEDALDADTGTV